MLEEKLKLLGEGAKYDVCASTSSHASYQGAAIGRSLPSGVCHSFTPDGRCISLFKVLLTNYCEKDCAYCPNQAARDVPRAKFSAEELAKLFMEFYQRNYVEGLFLSSGMQHSPTRTMEEIITVAEILRNRYHFGGYIHLKVLPGAKQPEVEAAARVANRLSLNMEAPSGKHLMRLSQTKSFSDDIVPGMQAIKRSLQQHTGLTHSTQYIVGASGESDLAIMHSAAVLYQNFRLQRAYFSAFQPVAGTPLAHLPSVPLLRENRLYQSDFLLRQYGFTVDELAFNAAGNFDLELDPKLAYALQHPERFPLEINRASYAELLRVPGIGPRSAAKIIKVRREHRFSAPQELKNAGIVLKRAVSFITIDGRFYGSHRLLARPQRPDYQQLTLWGDQRDHLLTNASLHG